MTGTDEVSQVLGEDPEPSSETCDSGFAAAGHSNEASLESLELKTVTLDGTKMKKAFEYLIDCTENIGGEQLEKLYWTLFRIIQQSVRSWDRSSLVKDINLEIDQFKKTMQKF